MSKVECTAVNELIDLVHSKPLDHRDSEEELLFASPEPRRATTSHRPPRALFSVEISTEPTEARATMPVIWTRKPEFEPTPRSDDDLRTVAVGKQLPIAMLAKRLALPMTGLLVVGIAIGGAITFRGEGRKQTTHVDAPSPFAAAAASVANQPTKQVIEQPIEAPAPAPVAEPIAPPAPVAKLVEVRIESNPPGATATLLDNGTSTPLGSTPLDATIDPAKSYDVVIAMEGHPSKVEHLDPSATQKLQVALDDAAPAPVVAKTKAKSKKHHAAKQAARVAAAPASRPAPARAKSSDPIAKLAAAKSGKDAAVPVATGMLSIATTPPCAILIDGTNSGLTTPQAAISLPAGHHSIRLIAAPQHVNKLVAVDIAPRKTTKLVQDFTK